MKYVVIRTWEPVGGIRWRALLARHFVNLTPDDVRWTGDDWAEAREQARKANREDDWRLYGRQVVML